MLPLVVFLPGQAIVRLTRLWWLAGCWKIEAQKMKTSECRDPRSTRQATAVAQDMTKRIQCRQCTPRPPDRFRRGEGKVSRGSESVLCQLLNMMPTAIFFCVSQTTSLEALTVLGS